MRKKLTEGFKSEGAPDLKYYAFDWDDNIVHMPTKILVKDEEGNEVGMSTDDFAEFRHLIGKEPFTYKGNKIVGYSDSPFRNFRTDGDKDFLVDSLRARKGPALDDFREAINNGSIFAIITARGHNPNTIKEAIYNYIIEGFNGIDKDELIKNLKKYRDIVGLEDKSDLELIREYLDLNKYYPVTFNDSSGTANPEKLKVDAMREFISYVKSQANILGKKLFVKNGITNKFIPSIGFSDDDIKNVETMKSSLEDEPALKTHYTGQGTKTRF
jgi:hypothetical protein